MRNFMESMISYEDYVEFVEAVFQMVSEKMGEAYEIEKIQTKKNNDTPRWGLMITKLQRVSEYVACNPTIYLEEFYENYQDVLDMDEVVQNVIYTYYECVDRFQLKKGFFEFDNLKDRICFKLVNYEMNQETLLDRPYRQFLDLAVVYYVFLHVDSYGSATIPVNNDLMQKWGTDEDELWELAYENTRDMLTPQMKSMKATLHELTGKIFEEVAPLFVLSNNYRLFGATSILYQEILQTIAEIYESNYYILPSSIHECIIYLDEGVMNKDELDMMIQEINQTQVEVEEVLANHAYYYDREKQEIQYGMDEKENDLQKSAKMKELAERLQTIFEEAFESNQPYATREENVEANLEILCTKDGVVSMLESLDEIKEEYDIEMDDEIEAVCKELQEYLLNEEQ